MLAFTLLVAAPALAHGGRFGPGVFPGPGLQPKGGPPGSPGSPRTPGGPGRPGFPAPPGTTALTLTASPHDTWTAWWALQRERFLPLRRALLSVDPGSLSDEFFIGVRRRSHRARVHIGRDQLRQRIGPALLAACQRRRSVDERSAALLALGKLGGDGAQSLTLFRDSLADSNLEVREAALLALGLLGGAEALELLAWVAFDAGEARALLGVKAVSDHDRVYAAYALGLLAREPLARGQRAQICEGLAQAFETSANHHRTAYLDAYSWFARGQGQAYQERLHRWLAAKNTFSVRVRAHVVTAIARSADERAFEALLAILARRREEIPIREAAVAGLGFLSEGLERQAKLRIVHGLERSVQKGRSQHEKHLAVLAMGECGLLDVAPKLVELVRGGSQNVRAHAALALGILSKRLEPELAWAQTLQRAFLATKNDVERGSIATALGLMEDQGSMPLLLDAFQRTNDEALKGHLAIALAGLGGSSARGTLRRALEDSLRRPVALRQIATALGLAGDTQAAPALIRNLKEARTTATRAALASALAWVADVRAIGPLLELLEEPEVTSEARAFAAVALGILAERGDRPWNLRYALAINQAAVFPHLLDGRRGVLDLL